ncbi:hypothetical protein PVK06_020083 [Gossypium arboreum]|uniref:Uncharacterized protein n=1 Tax=Gossypium arboreum TaxID=29729 RepID=A0ABR0PLR8_GOSAR|nr:hypothetical protein PVK06_020083 [Gossypium arboreum]
MDNSIDSTSIDHSSLPFSSSRLIQPFPCHDTVKLDKKSFVQWQQHVHLIFEGYKLLGFLEGILPVPMSSSVSETEKVEVILAGLSSEFDVVLTLASFSLEALPFQKLVDVLLEIEIHQTRTMNNVPMHANLVETPLGTESGRGDVCGGRSSGS